MYACIEDSSPEMFSGVYEAIFCTRRFVRDDLLVKKNRLLYGPGDEISTVACVISSPNLHEADGNE